MLNYKSNKMGTALYLRIIQSTYTYLMVWVVGILLSTDICAQNTPLRKDSSKSDKMLSSTAGGFGMNRKSLRDFNKNIPNGFAFIQGGTFFYKDNKSIEHKPATDTNLLLTFNQPKRYSLASFYLSKKEVTNAEYRKFVDWVIDSIALTMLAKKDPRFYADTMRKTLNWSLRREARDTSQMSSLYPLYFLHTPQRDSSIKGYQIDPSYVLYRTEVANSEKGKMISIYPDTLSWIRDIPFSYNNDPLSKRYFSHAAFNDYPVVGVSWEQANAYCDWLSQRMGMSCRLPNLLEFLYAYIPEEAKEGVKIGNVKQVKSTQRFFAYPWGVGAGIEVMDKKGNYLANFGPIIDEYGAMLKSYAGDGAFYTAKAGSYPATSKGLYDLAGNVSEWINHSLSSNFILNELYVAERVAQNKEYNPPSIDTNGKILYNIIAPNFDSIVHTLFEIYKYPEARAEWVRMGKPKKIEETQDLMDYLTHTIYIVLKQTHNILTSHAMLEKMSEPKAVMGGSWKDGAALMQFGEMQAYPASAKHCTIGFRVAISRTGL